MARPDLQPVVPAREVAQAVPQRPRARLHRALDVGRPLEQIGPADIADEDEVASGRRDRLIGRGAVGDEKREVLGRVPGRVHRLDDHVADRDAIAVPDQLSVDVRDVRVTRRPPVACVPRY